MAPIVNAAAAMALAGSAYAFVAPSAFKGGAVSARSASPSKLSMSVDCGINGFGRIGRLVARSMIKNPGTNLKLINTGAAPEYMAYQASYCYPPNVVGASNLRMRCWCESRHSSLQVYRRQVQRGRGATDRLLHIWILHSLEVYCHASCRE